MLGSETNTHKNRRWSNITKNMVLSLSLTVAAQHLLLSCCLHHYLQLCISRLPHNDILLPTSQSGHLQTEVTSANQIHLCNQLEGQFKSAYQSANLSVRSESAWFPVVRSASGQSDRQLVIQTGRQTVSHSQFPQHSTMCYHFSLFRLGDLEECVSCLISA